MNSIWGSLPYCNTSPGVKMVSRSCTYADAIAVWFSDTMSIPSLRDCGIWRNAVLSMTWL